jgi:hypothetical protein
VGLKYDERIEEELKPQLQLSLRVGIFIHEGEEFPSALEDHLPFMSPPVPDQKPKDD